MTTIHTGPGIVTLLHVFLVEQEKQQELLDLLLHAYGGTLRHREGFISCTLHRHVDGGRVMLYVQWRSIEQYEAVILDPLLPPFLYQALMLATFEADRYEVLQTFEPVT